MPMAVGRVTMGANGRVLIPLALREAMGLPEGGELLIEQQEDGTLLLMTREQAIRSVQDWAKQFRDPGGKSGTELLREMRDDDIAADELDQREHDEQVARLRQGVRARA
jgi:AbrB family looped-hinge helix DNA binding protein